MKFNKFFASSIIICTLLILQSSCKKLDENPRGFAAPENFYTTAGQIEAVFAATMNKTWDEWANVGYSYGWQYFKHDDQITGGDLNIPSNHARDVWYGHYYGVVNLNGAIRALKAGKVQGISATELDQLMGQAKFLRAWSYFMLVRLWGDLPLYTDLIADPAINPIARTPVAGVYELIVADFVEAAAKLPVAWPADKKGRPTVNAANGLLAKAYLTMATAPLNSIQNYAKAAEAAKKVIDGGRHSLSPNIDDVFKSANKYSSEMIWSWNSTYNDLSTNPQIWAPGELKGWSDFLVDPRFEQLWPDQPRKAAFLLTDLAGKHYTTWASKRPANRKWLPPNIPQSDYDSYAPSVNCPIIRYADVLLIYAEAANMANGSPTQAACDAINQVINRANGNVVRVNHPLMTIVNTKVDFDNRVINERSWELCFEYDRWFDLVRKRILDVNSPDYISNFSPNDYLFPIPLEDIRINPLLTQNSGYPKP